jgi:hypothetical protein
MSKLTEIRNQYQGYVAAIEAVKKTNPGDVEVVYKGHDDPIDIRDDGIFIYRPGENQIVIRPRRCMDDNYVHINANDVPALIKALREFFE